jgi:hypothetical protein
VSTIAYAPYGFIDGDMEEARRIAYATLDGRRIDPDDLLAADDIRGWVVESELPANGRYIMTYRRGEVRFFWKDEP